jgi:hypothetical protein
MGVTNELADARGTLISDLYVPLPDLGFDFLPYSPSIVWLPDLLIKLTLAVVFLRIFLSQARKRLACAFMEVHMSMMLLRCLTLPMTTFPAALPACIHKLSAKPDHILIEPIKRMFRPDALSSWCHDFLFSGHTVILVIAAMFLHDSGGLFWRLTGWGCLIIGAVLLTATR